MSDATVLQQEIAVEQQHVDRVYARLAELRRDASRAEKEGYQLAGVGTFGALVERDAMVFHAARRRHALDTEYEGLVFGRLDLNDRRHALRRPDGHPRRRARSRWSSTGGRRPPPPSTGPPRPTRWAWSGGG